MRREAIGIPGGAILVAAMLVLAYEGIVVYQGDSVLAGFLTQIASYLFASSLVVFAWTFKPAIERAIQPKVYGHVEVTGTVGISASATTNPNGEPPKPVQGRISGRAKLERISEVAVGGFGGGIVMIYVAVRLFAVLPKATAPLYSLVPVVCLGSGIFLFFFALYEILVMVRLR